jgi:hypothetical protein
MIVIGFMVRLELVLIQNQSLERGTISMTSGLGRHSWVDHEVYIDFLPSFHHSTQFRYD